MASFNALRKLSLPYLWPYFYARTSGVVQNFLNREALSLHQKTAHKLDPLSKKILESLEENGIALAHISELLPQNNWFSILQKEARNQLEKAKIGRKKTFLAYAWEGNPFLDLENSFIKLASDEKVLGVANAYLGMCSKLKFFSINRTIPENISGESGSQKWHRDPGIGKILKMFIYFTDVEAMGAGPFTYVLGSHLAGKYGKLFPQELYGRLGVYPPNGEVEKIVDPANIKSCFGKAGTMIFCDTIGLHKGGLSTQRERVMSTIHYETPSAFGKPKFKYPPDFNDRARDLSPIAKFAINP